MKQDNEQDNEGAFQQRFSLQFSLDNGTGRFWKDELEPIPFFDTARRFSCVFLSTSVKDAVRLNQHLSEAGIRAYHAQDRREAEVLLAITAAKILLIDIDHTFEPWLELLQVLDGMYPNVPKVILTASNDNIWSVVFSHSGHDVISRPAHLGDLLGALEQAHLVAQELNDPERARQREMRVMAAIRSAEPSGTSKHAGAKIGSAIVCAARSICRSIRVRLSAMIDMMDRVTHVWWKFGCHRTRKQHSHV